MTTTATAPAGSTVTATPACRVTPKRVLRSEWSKLWSLRSTWISLTCAAVLTLGVGMLVSQQYTSGGEGEFDPVQLTMIGTQFGHVIIAVLGILVSAGEYSTGMIRATMSAVPRRLPVLWSKAAVFGGVAFGAMLATVFVTFVVTQLLLSGTDKEAALGDAGVVRALLGTTTAMALLGVLTLSFGSLLRSVPGAIGLYIGGVVILPDVLGMVPVDAMHTVVKYLPMQASQALSAMSQAEGTIAPGTALLTLLGWAAAGLGSAAVLLARRDV